MPASPLSSCNARGAVTSKHVEGILRQTAKSASRGGMERDTVGVKQPRPNRGVDLVTGIRRGRDMSARLETGREHREPGRHGAGNGWGTVIPRLFLYNPNRCAGFEAALLFGLHKKTSKKFALGLLHQIRCIYPCFVASSSLALRPGLRISRENKHVDDGCTGQCE